MLFILTNIFCFLIGADFICTVQSQKDRQILCINLLIQEFNYIKLVVAGIFLKKVIGFKLIMILLNIFKWIDELGR